MPRSKTDPARVAVTKVVAQSLSVTQDYHVILTSRSGNSHMSLTTTTIDARGVATVTLNRPDKHNALDGALVRELHDTIAALGHDHGVRVVVLTAAGPSFCAGADIAHMRSTITAPEQAGLDDAQMLARCLRRLDELEQPLVVRVNGNAFGGGVGFVACADIAIAVRTARFALTEVRLGLVPAVISPYVVAAIGARQARRLFLSAAGFDADEAHGLGLLHYTADSEALDALVGAQIDLILRGGPLALKAAKKLVRRVSRADDRDCVDDSLDEELARLLMQLRASPEGKEGLSAFLERRKPSWHPQE